MRSSNNKRKKSKINIQKIFWLISTIFLLGSSLFYGVRFVKLYKDNKAKYGNTNTKNLLITKIDDNNHKNSNYKTINGEHYFINDSNNNYLKYSNILFRIVKINSDGEITLISDHAITSLAYGKSETRMESDIYKWLNINEDEEYTGIFEKSLNDIEKYLVKTRICDDKYKSLDNTECKDFNYDHYITLLSSVDYMNIGGKDSYVNNQEYFYLESGNDNDKQWYITNEGLSLTGNKIEIIGVKPVITLKNNISYINGDGSIDNPYTIEDKAGLFGSYVKIDDKVFRIYQVNETEVRIMLNNYFTVNDKDLEYIYSNNNSTYNHYTSNSIAYYLNNTFLNTLSCKNKIKTVKWSNGYYGRENNYNYVDSLKVTVDSKVALLSIGDIMLNDSLSEYFLMTGNKAKSSLVYAISESKKANAKSINQKLKIVPTLSIDKELLTNGSGTEKDPFIVD